MIAEHGKLMHAYSIQDLPLLPYCTPNLLSHTLPLSIVVITTILSLIPWTSVPALALLSRDFLSAVQAMLYGDLDMQNVQNHDMLWIFLITRQVLTSPMHTLWVLAWPSTRVLASMDNPRSLTLPSFDLHILCHCSAFGLCHMNLGTPDFLTWLNESCDSPHLPPFPVLAL